MVQNYHTKGDYNIIAVDWSVISSEETFYVVTAVDDLGQYVGDFIMEVTKDNYEYLSEVHLIGSSVGAQIAGAAGDAVAEKTNKKVDRITGLDPTKPENFEILDKDDAEFVDVIHTTVFYGEDNCGTVDFYVFADEPGKPICLNGKKKSLIRNFLYIFLETCGDLLAGDYYVTTIVDGNRFEGFSCHNGSLTVQKYCDKAKTVAMGEYVPRNVTGSFLVKAAASVIYSERFVLSIVVTLVMLRLIV